MQYKLVEEPNLAICPNTALLSVTNQMPAFIPPHCQRNGTLSNVTTPSLTGTKHPAIHIFSLSESTLCQWCQCFYNLSAARRRHPNLFLLRVLRSDPLKRPSQWQTGLFSPCVERQRGFHYSNKGCQRIRRTCRHWSMRANKRQGLCHPFVHVWSHISHLPLLGSLNLTEAFSRNPTDRII